MAMEQESKEQKITKEMMIGEFVESYPQLVDILLAEGVHCIGCGASGFESIEEGLMGHGKTDEEIDDVMKRLNESLKEEATEDLIGTEKAATKLNEILKSNNKEW